MVQGSLHSLHVLFSPKDSRKLLRDHVWYTIWIPFCLILVRFIRIFDFKAFKISFSKDYTLRQRFGSKSQTRQKHVTIVHDNQFGGKKRSRESKWFWLFFKHIWTQIVVTFLWREFIVAFYSFISLYLFCKFIFKCIWTCFV